MNEYIYPGNLKEKKTLWYMRAVDLLIFGFLVAFSVVYTAQNYSFVPLVFPATFLILKIRILDDGSNIWEKLIDAANYLVFSQQTFFWGMRKK